jgi:hypothetical protein
MSDYLETFFAGFDEARAAKAVADADAEALKAAAHAHSQRQVLDAYRAWKRTQDGDNTEAATTRSESAIDHIIIQAIPSKNGDTQSPTGRDAVRSVFLDDAADQEWTIPLVAEALGLGTEYHKRIGITLQRLVKDGVVVRPRKGRYKLPTETVAAGSVEEREAVSENGSQNGSGSAIRGSDLFGLSEPAPGVEPGSFS